MRADLLRSSLAGALASLFALWLAWSMASLGLAAHFTQTRPALALTLAPNLPDAFVSTAESRLERGRWLEAAALARKAIARDPLNAAALRTLGLALAQSGKGAAADAVMDFAADRTSRDTLLGAWLFRRRLQQGRVSAAFRYADALLRRDIDPILRTRLDESLVAAAGLETTLGPLARRLSTGPAWRAEFLEQMVAADGPDRARPLLFALAAGPASPTSGEIGPYIGRLVEARRFSEALADWRTLTRRQDRAQSPLRDGRFQEEPDGTPFTWSRTEGAGGAEDIRPAPGVIGGNALRIEYDGFATPAFPRQLLVLAPGRYRLSGLDWVESGQDDGRLRWTTVCAEGDTPLAQSSTRAVREAWRAMDLTFEVPASGCSGQWLQLSFDAGGRRRPVAIWYADLRLDRLE